MTLVGTLVSQFGRRQENADAYGNINEWGMDQIPDIRIHNRNISNYR